MKNLPVRLRISRFFVAREGLSMLFCKQIRARIPGSVDAFHPNVP